MEIPRSPFYANFFIFIRVYVYTCIIMPKTKLTLTIDKDVIRKAKSRLALEDKSISEVVEVLLKSYAISWIDKLMAQLGIKERYLSYDSVIKNRKRGLDAGKIIRSMRDARAKSISR